MANVIPVLVNGGNLTITTTSGATPVSFPSQPCTQLTIANNTSPAALLEFNTNGGTVYQPVFAGTYYTIYGINNVSQVGIRRNDQASTSTVINARWEGGL